MSVRTSEVQTTCGLESTFKFDPASRIFQIHDSAGDQSILMAGGVLAVPHDTGDRHGDLCRMFSAAGFATREFRLKLMQGVFGIKSNKVCGSRCRCPQRARYTSQCEDGPVDVCPWTVFPQVPSRVVPDAFMICQPAPGRTAGLVIVVEVDVTHTPPASKYEPLWWWLDEESWSLCELRCDRFGHVHVLDHDYFQGHFS